MCNSEWQGLLFKPFFHYTRYAKEGMLERCRRSERRHNNGALMNKKFAAINSKPSS